MFRLKRYFLLLSLPAFILVLIFSYYSQVDFARKMLVEQESRANVNQAKIIQQLIWPKYAAFIQATESGARSSWFNSEEVNQLDNLFSGFLRGTAIAKIKLYNLHGITIYSSQKSQIGEDKSSNPGFLDAKSGRVHSNLTFRDQFHAIEHVIVDRNLLTSYIPLYDRSKGEVAAVFEVYSDVTELVQQLDKLGVKMITKEVFIFTALFLIMFFIIHSAERMLKQNHHELDIANKRIREMAFKDCLTELPNRNSFINHMQGLMSRRQSEHGFSLLYIDLDNFKKVNDLYGHSAGDSVLRVISGRLINSIRDTDRAYRLAGDEFTIILHDTYTVSSVETVVSNLLDVISRPLNVKGVDAYLTASIGIAMFPEHSENPDELLDVADKAMYRAKQKGENMYEFGVTSDIAQLPATDILDEATGQV